LLGEIDHPELDSLVSDLAGTRDAAQLVVASELRAGDAIDEHPALPCIVVAEPTLAVNRRGIRRRWQASGASECIFTDELSPVVLALAMRSAVLDSDLAGERAVEAARRQTMELDPISGLCMKAGFLRALQLAVDGQRSGGAPYSLLVLDIERYGQVAEGLGFDAAEQLLVAVSLRLSRILRACDVAARLDGQRFGLIVGRDGDGDRARELAERIRVELVDPFIIAGESVSVSARMGVTPGARNYGTTSEVMRDALSAMSRARKPGTAQIFRSAFRNEAVERFRIESALGRALEDGQMHLHYQPIISLASQRLMGFEALLRWEHPTIGNIRPDKFIPVAEESGAILEIGRWVMETASRQMRMWNEEFELEGNAMVSVNVSGRQLVETNFVEEVERVIARTGIDPQCLKVELTETVLMENADHVAAVIQQLRNMGVQVWIDDFGTGYSSLRYLQRFPISGLKIDKSFVDPLDGTSESAAMASTIVTLAQSIGVEVIAEGIEHAHQAEELVKLGCTSGQGYLYSKPISVAEAYALLGHS
jgi:Amt family ammonium transporter